MSHPTSSPDQSSPPLLEVVGLSKVFVIHHLERRIHALQDIHFSLQPGRFLRLNGPNGAGKSTVLRCLYRTYHSSSGSLHYTSLAGTIDLAQASDVDIVWLRRREIAFVTQFLNPRPRVPALQLVAEPLHESGLDAKAAAEAARDLLHRLGLRRELWGAYPATFSGGEQQKVNLARGLAVPKRLLLLDEPTASLDREARQALVQKLAEIKAQGTAIVGVLHHPEDLAALIDETLELQDAGVGGVEPD